MTAEKSAAYPGAAFDSGGETTKLSDMWLLHCCSKTIHYVTMKHLIVALFLSLLFSAAPAFAEGPFAPDPKLTPGDILEVTKKDVCVVGYTKKVRNVPGSVRKEVFQRYGIPHPTKGAYEVDHLISLELGGSNSIKNLFPQAYQGLWNARVKDALENKLHKLVCTNKLSLTQAQDEIASDWIGAYKKYFKTGKPVTNKKR